MKGCFDCASWLPSPPQPQVRGPQCKALGTLNGFEGDCATDVTLVLSSSSAVGSQLFAQVPIAINSNGFPLMGSIWQLKPFLGRLASALDTKQVG